MQTFELDPKNVARAQIKFPAMFLSVDNAYALYIADTPTQSCHPEPARDLHFVEFREFF
jgi:hypothetical protein